MSKLEGMLIQGIRSYSNTTPAMINFETPITLIVGANGAGKTTIIESLNYVTTGELPPGTKMASFIHDPKIVKEVEVKGQVKLKFTDASGHQCVCTRTLICTQKAKKMEAKSMEGCLVTMNAEGKKTSISSRCADLTKEMIHRLSVSKSLIENVIFCHQENSCWPLSEGKILKDKFDEIFSASKYIKALENIRNLRKSQIAFSKELKVDLSHCEITMNKAAEIKLNFDRTKLKIESLHKEIIEIESRVSSLKAENIRLRSLLDRITALKSNRDELMKITTMFEQTNRRIDSLGFVLYNGTIEEIEAKLADTSKQSANCDKNTNEIINHRDSLILTLSEHENQRNSHILTKDRYARNLELLRNETSSLICWINSFYQKYLPKEVLLIDSESIEISVVESVKEKIRKYFEQLLREQKVQIMKVEEAIISAKKDLDHNFLRMREIDTRVEISSIRAKVINSESGEIHNKLMQIRNMIPANLSKILIKIEQEEQRGSELQNSIEKLPNINELTLEKTNLTNKSCSIHQSLKFYSDLSLHSIKIIEMEEKKNQLDEAAKSLCKSIIENRAFNSICTSLEDCRGYRLEEICSGILPIDSNTITILYAAIENQKCVLQTKLQECQLSRGEINAFLKSTQEKIQKQNALLNKTMILFEDQNRKVSEILGIPAEKVDFELILSRSDENISCLRQKLSNDKSKVEVFQKFLSVASDSKENFCCPLCEQNFKNIDSFQSFCNKLEQNVHKLTTEIKQEETTLNELSKSSEELSVFKDIKLPKTFQDEIDLLKTEIGQLELEVSSYNEKEKIILLDESVSKENLHFLSSLKSLLQQLERLNCDFHEVELNITKLKSSIDHDNLQVDHKDITKKQSELTSELKEINTEIATMQSKIDDTLSKSVELHQAFSTSTNELKRLENEKREYCSEFEKEKEYSSSYSERQLELEGLAKNQEELFKEKDHLKTTISEVKSNLDDLSRQKKILENELTNVKIDETRTLQAFSIKLKSLNALVGVSEYNSKLVIVENEILEVDEKIKKLKIQIEETNEKINLSQSVNQERTTLLRRLSDSLEYLKNCESISSNETQLIKIDNDIKSVGNYEQIKGQLEDVETLQMKSREKIASIYGNISGLQSQCQHLEAELMSDMFRDADQKYQHKAVELALADMTGSDLDKFYKALDSSIMKFHQMKMKEINLIIYELWNSVYQSHDVEYIEIRSEEEDGYGSNKSRRAYNYKVVMIRNGVSLDMRGHCSAGQKVLASIIIRMALAEVFCVNCGILALDEPTSNLDRSNIEGLSNAIIRLMTSKQRISHFQLLIITHDEEFVQKLSHARLSEYYYRIYKDESGFSTIHRQRVQDLLD